MDRRLEVAWCLKGHLISNDNKFCTSLTFVVDPGLLKWMRTSSSFLKTSTYPVKNAPEVSPHPHPFHILNQPHDPHSGGHLASLPSWLFPCTGKSDIRLSWTKFPNCLCGISTRQLELLLWRAGPTAQHMQDSQSSLYS